MRECRCRLEALFVTRSSRRKRMAGFNAIGACSRRSRDWRRVASGPGRRRERHKAGSRDAGLKSLCGNSGVDGTGILRAGGRCAMPNFLEYNPEQAYLLPPSVRDVLGEGHLCFFVHGAVERLDLGEFEAAYSEEGHPAYHPALLLKVWLYAYALGVTSSRRLEQRIREDLAFRYLAGGAQPDFWALNEF